MTARLGALRGVAAASAGVAFASLRAARAEETDRRRLRVLITGFHDWRDLDDEPGADLLRRRTSVAFGKGGAEGKGGAGAMWRCRDNPSCRLIYGEACAAPPLIRRGPLVRALSALEERADFSYVTMPVLWGTASGLDVCAYDVVIHMGLGVYDRTDLLRLESGAYNGRNGTDALARARDDERIEATEGRHVQCDAMASRVDAVAAACKGGVGDGFELEVAGSTAENSYICNETHWRGLKACAASGQRLAAYFLHLPYASADDHVALAAAVAGVVREMVRLEAARRDAAR